MKTFEKYLKSLGFTVRIKDNRLVAKKAPPEKKGTGICIIIDYYTDWRALSASYHITFSLVPYKRSAITTQLRGGVRDTLPDLRKLMETV